MGVARVLLVDWGETDQSPQPLWARLLGSPILPTGFSAHEAEQAQMLISKSSSGTSYNFAKATAMCSEQFLIRPFS